ncbi:MAG TPA: iron-containing alcohol dehydrogenase [Trebonia sp.]
MIVRWGLAELPGVLDEVSISRPLLISTERWRHLQLPVLDRFYGVRAHAEVAGVRAAREAAGGADGLIALGGGSAIDTAKAVSSQTGLPVVSIPTTYSGAEWTSGYGVRVRSERKKFGGGGARTVAIIYEPELTLGLPVRESAGSAMNALAHCAEALYTAGRRAETDAQALAGAPLIARWLPVVAGFGHDLDLEARRGLLAGAMHAGAALRAGAGLGHAIAQALGGRYGLLHGTMNAVSLPAALRFNSIAAVGELARFGRAIGHADPLARVSELAALAGPLRLRDYRVPREDLSELAQATADLSAAKANPRPAPPDAVLELLEEIW